MSEFQQPISSNEKQTQNIKLFAWKTFHPKNTIIDERTEKQLQWVNYLDNSMHENAHSLAIPWRTNCCAFYLWNQFQPFGLLSVVWRSVTKIPDSKWNHLEMIYFPSNGYRYSRKSWKKINAEQNVTHWIANAQAHSYKKQWNELIVNMSPLWFRLQRVECATWCGW